MKMLVAGGGFANKGAEAMTLTVRSAFPSRSRRAEWVLWDCPGVERQIARAEGFDPLTRPGGFSRPSRLLWLLQRVASSPDLTARGLLMDPVGSFAEESARAMLEQAGRFDAVIDVSGFGYGDPWGPAYPRAMMPLFRRAAEIGARVVFAPQSWGPFRDLQVRRAVAEMLDMTDPVVYARDRASLGHLSELGVRLDVRLSADLAFAFGDTAPAYRADDIVLRSGAASGPIVAFVPNIRAYERARGSAWGNAHLRAMGALVSACIEQTEATVVLLAMEHRARSRSHSDEHLCRLIASAVPEADRCAVVAGPLRAAEVWSLLGRCDLVVSSRFHALVFALAHGVPCVGLGWSEKYGELMREFGCLAAFSEELAHTHRAAEVFREQWSRRAENAARLAPLAVAARERARNALATIGGEVMRATDGHPA